MLNAHFIQLDEQIIRTDKPRISRLIIVGIPGSLDRTVIKEIHLPAQSARVASKSTIPARAVGILKRSLGYPGPARAKRSVLFLPWLALFARDGPAEGPTPPDSSSSRLLM